MNREVQHKVGMAAGCPILASAKPTEAPQCKQRRLEGHHVDLEYQSVSGRKAGPSGMVSGLHVWGPVLGSHYLPSHRVTSPGAGREDEAHQPSGVPTPAFMPSAWSLRSTHEAVGAP